MILTKRSDYGLGAILELARAHGSQAMSAREIAERRHMPIAFTRKLLQVLRCTGFVTSSAGQRGGYSLALPPKEISLLGLLETLEGDLAPVRCLMSDSHCKFSQSCDAQRAWRSIEAVIRDALIRVSLQDLLDRSELKGR